MSIGIEHVWLKRKLVSTENACFSGWLFPRHFDEIEFPSAENLNFISYILSMVDKGITESPVTSKLWIRTWFPLIRFHTICLGYFQIFQNFTSSRQVNPYFLSSFIYQVIWIKLYIRQLLYSIPCLCIHPHRSASFDNTLLILANSGERYFNITEVHVETCSHY